ncbi:MAG TPA: SIMPL domain-containing protein [Vicinamibacterales bacterium]|nr:SIMPL domain-containing protein [Vicinamibacterales bacterium]
MSTVMLAILLLALPQAAAQEALNVVVTTGEAVVQRAPDRAFVTIASEARAKTSREATRLNAEAMAAVQQRLTQAGIARDAIRTLGVDLQQEFDFPQGRRVPREYVARNTIEVRIDDLARVGDVLDVAVQAGATATSNVRFDLRDRSGAEREALRLAVADARARADAAVAGAGRSIDRIVKIEDARESNVIVPRPMVAGFAKAEAAAAPTPVEAGMIEIRARVTLTAAMK